jgi:ribosomal-protein-alanine N-acetyltransferase
MSSKVNFKLISLNSRWIDSVLDIERLCYIAPWNRESIEQSLVGYEAIGAVVGPKQLVSYLMYSHVLDEVSILNVAVHPDYRRQGLAAAMLSWLNQHAKELGVKKVFLEVSRSNQKA